MFDKKLNFFSQCLKAEVKVPVFDLSFSLSHIPANLTKTWPFLLLACSTSLLVAAQINKKDVSSPNPDCQALLRDSDDMEDVTENIKALVKLGCHFVGKYGTQYVFGDQGECSLNDDCWRINPSFK